MSRIKKTFVLLTTLVLAGTLAIPAFAVEKTQAGNSPWTIHVNSQVRWGTNDRTIFTLDFLVPFYQGEKNILFFNPRLNMDNRDGKEVNFGFGYRHLLFSDKAILGVNGYYDSRRTGWGTRHEQVGIGAEVMTDWVTGRMNGYFAITDPQVSGMTGPSDGYYFRDIGLFTGSGSLEETLSGFDGEVGCKIPYLSKYMETWAYAGGYHFQGKYVEPVNGFSSRLEVIPTDFLRLNFEYRNDTLHHNQYYGEVAVAIPFSIENLLAGKNPFKGLGSRIGGDRTLKERMTEPVRRDVDVQVYVVGSGPNAPGTQTKVEDIVFVSETGDDATGKGTFENPYKSIDWAAKDSRITSYVCNIIHVINANGTDSAQGGSVSRDGLLIWGSGVDNPLYPVISNMTSGYPDVVAYNSNDFVLSVDAPDTTITGLGLTTPSVVGGNVYGIRVNNGQGLSITENEIGSGIMDGYGIYSNLIGLGNVGAPEAPAVIANNTINLVSGMTGTGIYLGADNVYANITDNTISGTSSIASGITLASAGDIGSATSPLLLRRNTINLSGYEVRGITYTAGLDDSAVSSVDFAEILGGDFSSLPSVIGSGDAYVKITSNTISESGDDTALGITGIATGYHIAALRGNTVTLTDSDIASGILVAAGGGLSARIRDNTITENGDYAALGITGMGDNTSLTVLNNTLNLQSPSGGVSGILLGSLGNLNSRVKGNTITGNGNYAALGITGIGGVTSLTVTNNTLNLQSPGGGVSGILLASLSDLNSRVNGNTIIGNGKYAALGITEFALGDFGFGTRSTVSGNTIDIGSDYFASGILLGAGGDLRVNVTDNILGPDSVYGGALALDVTLVNYDGVFDARITGNELNVMSDGANLPVGDMISFLDGLSLPTGLDPTAFGTYNIGAASGIMALSIAGTFTPVISDNDVYVSGNSLAGGITAANLFGDIGTETDPLLINDNNLTVYAEGGGDLGQLIADLLSVYGVIPGLSLPEGFDGAASGIAMLTGGDIYARVNRNTLGVYGNLGALGITAFGDDIGSAAAPLMVNDNLLDIESGYVSSGILLFAMNRLNAHIINTHGDEDAAHIEGGYAALGITGIALNLTDDGNDVVATDNNLDLYSEGVTSGILLASLNNLNFNVQRNDIHGEAGYAALGITALSGDDIGNGTPAVVSNNKISLYSDYVSSGILLLATDDLTANVRNNDLSDPIHGDVAALGISLLSFAGDINASVNRNDLNIGADGGTPIDGDLLGSLVSMIDPAYPMNPLEDSYNLGVASGILVASYGGDIYGTVSHNGRGQDEFGNPINTIFNVSGATAAGGVILASYGGGLYSTISDNALTVMSGGTGYFGNDIDQLLADIGLDLGYMPFPGFDGAASGITLITGSGGGIYSNVVNNPLISVTGNSLGAGVLMYAYDGNIGIDSDPLLINNNNIYVGSNMLGCGVIGMAGWNIDDGSSTFTPRSIFARINANDFNVSAPMAAGAYIDVSGWIGSSATPFRFTDNSGTISGFAPVMLALLGDSGTSADPNYVRWGGNTIETALGPWGGNFPISGDVLGAIALDPYDPTTHPNPLYWGWNISPKTIITAP